MKIIVISDSHGNIANIKHVMGFAKKIDARAVIHCGDWDDIESVETVLSYKIPLYSVLGNADVTEGLEDILKFESKKFAYHLLKLNLDGRKIGVIHRANLKDPELTDYNIIFSGHYHSKDEKMVNFTTFIRPGALINGNNFAVYETINNKVEFFSE
jgi:putative phosphoesterase